MALNTASADLDVVCKAVAAKVAAVDGIGSVEDRPGSAPTWIKSSLSDRAYWEVDITAATEGLTSVATATEYIYIMVEGYLPYHLDDPGNSAEIFRGLIKLVKAVLREDEDLSGLVDRSELPQCEANDFVSFPEDEKNTKCHHCRITIQYQRDFSFNP